MAVHHEGKTSQRQLAKRFNVALSFIEKLIKQEETGSIAPKRRGSGSKPKLTDEQNQVVLDLIAADNDATLVELCEQLAARIGVRVGRSTMGRITPQLNLTVEKNVSGD